jgi:hypothetical protein
MTDDDIKRLRELAQAATLGPWKVEGNGLDEWYVYAHDARYAAPWCGDSPVKVAWVPWEPSGGRHVRDSLYIAAASPDVVLALLDRLEAAERERDSLRVAYEQTRQDCVNLTEKVLPNLRAERDALPADAREVMRLALEAIVGYRRELADSQPCDAEILLRAVLGEPKR